MLINRRAELIVALPPLREKFDKAVAGTPDPALASALSQTQSRIAVGAARAQPVGGRAGGAEHARP